MKYIAEYIPNLYDFNLSISENLSNNLNLVKYGDYELIEEDAEQVSILSHYNYSVLDNITEPLSISKNFIRRIELQNTINEKIGEWEFTTIDDQNAYLSVRTLERELIINANKGADNSRFIQNLELNYDMPPILTSFIDFNLPSTLTPWKSTFLSIKYGYLECTNQIESEQIPYTQLNEIRIELNTNLGKEHVLNEINSYNLQNISTQLYTDVLSMIDSLYNHSLNLSMFNESLNHVCALRDNNTSSWTKVNDNLYKKIAYAISFDRLNNDLFDELNYINYNFPEYGTHKHYTFISTYEYYSECNHINPIGVWLRKNVKHELIEGHTPASDTGWVISDWSDENEDKSIITLTRTRILNVNDGDPELEIYRNLHNISGGGELDVELPEVPKHTHEYYKVIGEITLNASNENQRTWDLSEFLDVSIPMQYTDWIILESQHNKTYLEGIIENKGLKELPHSIICKDNYDSFMKLIIFNDKWNGRL